MTKRQKIVQAMAMTLENRGWNIYPLGKTCIHCIRRTFEEEAFHIRTPALKVGSFHSERPKFCGACGKKLPTEQEIDKSLERDLYAAYEVGKESEERSNA